MEENGFCNTPFPTTEKLDALECQTDPGCMDNAAKVTADIDSIFLLSSNYNNVIDAACPNGTTWNFPNIIQRTRSDIGSRVKLHFNNQALSPSLEEKKQIITFLQNGFQM